MSNEVIDLGYDRLFLTYVFIVITMLLTTFNGVNRNKEIIIGTLRMTVQLFIAGFVLIYIFKSNSVFFTGAMIIVMESFAVYNIVSPKKGKLPKGLFGIITVAQFVGTIFTIVFFLILVVRPTPLYDPQYLIPLGGMIIGNSMTGINLALNTLLNSIETQSSTIEGSLMLGATPKMALDKIIQQTFDTAILPTLNSIKSMGIISLPGMMTGQILAGISPITAIKYQIAIMTAILGSVTICIFIFLHFGYKKFFNSEEQLI